MGLLRLVFINLYAIFVNGLSNPLDLHHNPENFLQTYLKYKPICGNPKENIVLPRHDPYNLNIEDMYRNWTISTNPIFDFLNIDPIQNKVKSSRKPECKSYEEVINSISYRVSDQPCQILWFSSEKICEIMNQYSLILWSGDSLTRHLMQGMSMILESDFRYGGLPLGQRKEIYDHCGCDGQFSESLLCREPWAFGNRDTTKSSRTTLDLRSLGYCSTNHFMKNFGLHCGMDVNRCQHDGQRYMTFIYTHFAECLDRIRIVYSGSIVSSDELTKKYPDQKRQRVLDYNHNMAIWMDKNYPHVKSVNFYNLSIDTLDHTSDGFHQMSDGNLIKAMEIVNMMYHMVNVTHIDAQAIISRFKTRYKAGELVRFENERLTYLVGNDSLLHGFPDLHTFTAMGYDFDNVILIDPQLKSSSKVGEMLPVI